MTNSDLIRYRQRFIRVSDYIETHLDDVLNLEVLSQVAHCSRFHFHRQFSELAGITVNRFIQHKRLKRAAYQLAYRQDKIIDIALKAGYENPESFSRAFKTACRQTPSQFRKSSRWQPWHSSNSFEFIKENKVMSVEIIAFPQTRLAVYEHKGPIETVYQSVQQFIRWRKAHKLSPGSTKTYNIFYHDPASVLPAEYRMDIAVATDQAVSEDAAGIMVKHIPAGRCAYLRHHGSWDTLESSMRYLYGQWLPDSGEELGDFPCFVERVNLFPEVPESELITDIYLPLE